MIDLRSVFERNTVGASGFDGVADIAIDLCDRDGDALITKRALCRLFECSERTIQRMVARRDLPPPLTMAGRKYWAAGTLGKWLSDAAKRKQADLEAECRRLRGIMRDRWNN